MRIARQFIAILVTASLMWNETAQAIPLSAAHLLPVAALSSSTFFGEQAVVPAELFDLRSIVPKRAAAVLFLIATTVGIIQTSNAQTTASSPQSPTAQTQTVEEKDPIAKAGGKKLTEVNAAEVATLLSQLHDYIDGLIKLHTLGGLPEDIRLLKFQDSPRKISVTYREDPLFSYEKSEKRLESNSEPPQLFAVNATTFILQTSSENALLIRKHNDGTFSFEPLSNQDKKGQEIATNSVWHWPRIAAGSIVMAFVAATVLIALWASGHSMDLAAHLFSSPSSGHVLQAGGVLALANILSNISLRSAPASRRGFLAVTGLHIWAANLKASPRPRWQTKEHKLNFMDWGQYLREALDNPDSAATKEALKTAQESTRGLSAKDPEWAERVPLFFDNYVRVSHALKAKEKDGQRALAQTRLAQEINDQVLTKRGWFFIWNGDTHDDSDTAFHIGTADRHGQVQIQVTDSDRGSYERTVPFWTGNLLNLDSRDFYANPDEAELTGKRFGSPDHTTIYFYDKSFQSIAKDRLEAIAKGKPNELIKLSDRLPFERDLVQDYHNSLERDGWFSHGQPHPNTEQTLLAMLLGHEIAHYLTVPDSGFFTPEELPQAEAFARLASLQGPIPYTTLMELALETIAPFSMGDETYEKIPAALVFHHLATALGRTDLAKRIENLDMEAPFLIKDALMALDRQTFNDQIQKAKENFGQPFKAPRRWRIKMSWLPVAAVAMVAVLGAAALLFGFSPQDLAHGGHLLAGASPGFTQAGGVLLGGLATQLTTPHFLRFRDSSSFSPPQTRSRQPNRRQALRSIGTLIAGFAAARTLSAQQAQAPPAPSPDPLPTMNNLVLDSLDPTNDGTAVAAQLRTLAAIDTDTRLRLLILLMEFLVRADWRQDDAARARLQQIIGDLASLWSRDEYFAAIMAMHTYYGFPLSIFRTALAMAGPGAIGSSLEITTTLASTMEDPRQRDFALEWFNNINNLPDYFGDIISHLLKTKQFLNSRGDTASSGQILFLIQQWIYRFNAAQRIFALRDAGYSRDIWAILAELDPSTLRNLFENPENMKIVLEAYKSPPLHEVIGQLLQRLPQLSQEFEMDKEAIDKDWSAREQNDQEYRKLLVAVLGSEYGVLGAGDQKDSLGLIPSDRVRLFFETSVIGPIAEIIPDVQNHSLARERLLQFMAVHSDPQQFFDSPIIFNFLLEALRNQNPFAVSLFLKNQVRFDSTRRQLLRVIAQLPPEQLPTIDLSEAKQQIDDLIPQAEQSGLLKKPSEASQNFRPIVSLSMRITRFSLSSWIPSNAPKDDLTTRQRLIQAQAIGSEEILAIALDPHETDGQQAARRILEEQPARDFSHDFRYYPEGLNIAVQWLGTSMDAFARMLLGNFWDPVMRATLLEMLLVQRPQYALQIGRISDVVNILERGEDWRARRQAIFLLADHLEAVPPNPGERSIRALRYAEAGPDEALAEAAKKILQAANLPLMRARAQSPKIPAAVVVAALIGLLGFTSAALGHPAHTLQAGGVLLGELAVRLSNWEIRRGFRLENRRRRPTDERSNFNPDAPVPFPAKTNVIGKETLVIQARWEKKDGKLVADRISPKSLVQRIFSGLPVHQERVDRAAAARALLNIASYENHQSHPQESLKKFQQQLSRLYQDYQSQAANDAIARVPIAEEVIKALNGLSRPEREQVMAGLVQNATENLGMLLSRWGDGVADWEHAHIRFVINAGYPLAFNARTGILEADLLFFAGHGQYGEYLYPARMAMKHIVSQMRLTRFFAERRAAGNLPADVGDHEPLIREVLALLMDLEEIPALTRYVHSSKANREEFIASGGGRFLDPLEPLADARENKSSNLRNEASVILTAIQSDPAWAARVGFSPDVSIDAMAAEIVGLWDSLKSDGTFRNPIWLQPESEQPTHPSATPVPSSALVHQTPSQASPGVRRVTRVVYEDYVQEVEQKPEDDTIPRHLIGYTAPLRRSETTAVARATPQSATAATTAKKDETIYVFTKPNRGMAHYLSLIDAAYERMVHESDPQASARIFLETLWPQCLIALADDAAADSLRARVVAAARLLDDTLARDIEQLLNLSGDIAGNRTAIQALSRRLRGNDFLQRNNFYLAAEVLDRTREGTREPIALLTSASHEIDDVETAYMPDGRPVRTLYLGNRVDRLNHQLSALAFTFHGDTFGVVVKPFVERQTRLTLLGHLYDDHSYLVPKGETLHPISHAIDRALRKDYPANPTEGQIQAILANRYRSAGIHERQHTQDMLRRIFEHLPARDRRVMEETSAYLASMAYGEAPFVDFVETLQLYLSYHDRGLGRLFTILRDWPGIYKDATAQVILRVARELGMEVTPEALEAQPLDVCQQILNAALALDSQELTEVSRRAHWWLVGPQVKLMPAFVPAQAAAAPAGLPMPPVERQPTMPRQPMAVALPAAETPSAATLIGITMTTSNRLLLKMNRNRWLQRILLVTVGLVLFIWLDLPNKMGDIARMIGPSLGIEGGAQQPRPQDLAPISRDSLLTLAAPAPKASYRVQPGQSFDSVAQDIVRDRSNHSGTGYPEALYLIADNIGSVMNGDIDQLPAGIDLIARPSYWTTAKEKLEWERLLFREKGRRWYMRRYQLLQDALVKEGQRVDPYLGDVPNELKQLAHQRGVSLDGLSRDRQALLDQIARKRGVQFVRRDLVGVFFEVLYEAQQVIKEHEPVRAVSPDKSSGVLKWIPMILLTLSFWGATFTSLHSHPGVLHAGGLWLVGWLAGRRIKASQVSPVAELRSA